MPRGRRSRHWLGGPVRAIARLVAQAATLMATETRATRRVRGVGGSSTESTLAPAKIAPSAPKKIPNGVLTSTSSESAAQPAANRARPSRYSRTPRA
jgi:hypothetical protein